MKKVILASLALLIITLLGCTKEEKEKPPYPKGTATFEGQVLFNGQKINGIGSGTAFIEYKNESKDTVSVSFADYEYRAVHNKWVQLNSVGLDFGLIPTDSMLLEDDGNNFQLYTTKAIYTENVGNSDALVPPWQSDSGFYSLQLNPDSSINAHIAARLVDGALSETVGFQPEDTIQLYIKGKFIPR